MPETKFNPDIAEEALRQAVAGSTRGDDTDDLVARARAFYDFLAGKDWTSGQTDG